VHEKRIIRPTVPRTLPKPERIPGGGADDRTIARARREASRGPHYIPTFLPGSFIPFVFPDFRAGMGRAGITKNHSSCPHLSPAILHLTCPLAPPAVSPVLPESTATP